MSVDTYFCICCLSTNDLTNLYDSNGDKNYIILIKDFLSIEPSIEDYIDDGYICMDCAVRLKDAHKFKTQVFETLNILQVNGLLDLRRDLVIKKISSGVSSDVEDKDRIKVNNKSETEERGEKETESILMKINQEAKPVKIESKQIKQEKQFPVAANLKIIDGSDIIRSFIKNCQKKSIVELERDKCVETEKREKRTESYEITKDFKCKMCGVVLPNAYVYHTHMNKHFPNHICELCGKGYLTQKRLKRHLTSHDKGPFRCQICDAEFTNYNTYYAHVKRKHSCVEQYACPYCPERFRTFTRRARHLAAAHAQPAGKYRCHVCDKSFLLAGNLSTHMRSKHLQVKRHFCRECGASYFHKQDLTSHAASHSGANGYQCGHCTKSYPRKKALKVHLRTHTDDKPFSCDACGKKFTQKCTLLSHMKTHDRANEKKRITTQKATKLDNLQPKVAGKGCLQPNVAKLDILQPAVAETEFLKSEFIPSEGESEQSEIVNIGGVLMESKLVDTDFVQPTSSKTEHLQPKWPEKVYLQPKVAETESMQSNVANSLELTPTVTNVEDLHKPVLYCYNYKLFYE